VQVKKKYIRKHSEIRHTEHIEHMNIKANNVEIYTCMARYDKGKGNTEKKNLKSVQCLMCESKLCIPDTQFAMSGIATAVIPQNVLSLNGYY